MATRSRYWITSLKFTLHKIFISHDYFWCLSLKYQKCNMYLKEIAKKRYSWLTGNIFFSKTSKIWNFHKVNNGQEAHSNWLRIHLLFRFLIQEKRWLWQCWNRFPVEIWKISKFWAWLCHGKPEILSVVVSWETWNFERGCVMRNLKFWAWLYHGKPEILSVVVSWETWNFRRVCVMGNLKFWAWLCHGKPEILSVVVSWETWNFGRGCIMGNLKFWAWLCHGKPEILGVFVSWETWNFERGCVMGNLKFSAWLCHGKPENFAGMTIITQRKLFHEL